MRLCHSVAPIRAVLALMICSIVLPGCESLSTTQLWKLNRHPRESYGGDAYFSVPSGALTPASNSQENQGIPQVAAF
jgi:hypothetical protein